MGRRLSTDLPRARTCTRCHFTLPSSSFERRARTCLDCRAQTTPQQRVAGVAADYMLRCHGARSLLKLGLTQAASELLAHGTWPTLRAARRMQQEVAAAQATDDIRRAS